MNAEMSPIIERTMQRSIDYAQTIPESVRPNLSDSNVLSIRSALQSEPFDFFGCLAHVAQNIVWGNSQTELYGAAIQKIGSTTAGLGLTTDNLVKLFEKMFAGTDGHRTVQEIARSLRYAGPGKAPEPVVA